MKKKLFLLVTLTLCLTGCQGKNTVEDEVTIPTEAVSEIISEEEANLDEEVVEETDAETDVETDTEIWEDQLVYADNVTPLYADEELIVCGKSLLIQGEDPEDYGVCTVALTYDGQKLMLDVCNYLGTSLVVETGDDSFYVFVKYYGDNDWVQTELVRFTPETGFVRTEPVWGSVDGTLPITTDKCTIKGRAEILGIYSTICDYTISESGMTRIGDYIGIINEKMVEDGSFLDGFEDDARIKNIYDKDGRRILKLKTNLTVKTQNGDLELKAGDSIYPIGYNMEDKTFYFEANGVDVYVNFDEEIGGGYSIDGVNEYELFEVLLY